MKRATFIFPRNRVVPTSLRCARAVFRLLPPVFAAVLATPVLATIIPPSRPDQCVTNDPALTCFWVEDSRHRGSFIMSHAAAVTENGTHMPGTDDFEFGIGSFVSPNENWLVKIESIIEGEQTSPRSGLFFDKVVIVGTMTHIEAADGADLSRVGDPHSFFLDLGTFFNGFPVSYFDSDFGLTQHDPHKDTYRIIGEADSASAGNNAEVDSYSMIASGTHTPEGPPFFDDGIMLHDPQSPSFGDFGDPVLRFDTDGTLSFEDIALDTIQLDGSVPSPGDPIADARLFIDDVALIRSVSGRSYFAPAGLRINDGLNDLLVANLIDITLFDGGAEHPELDSVLQGKLDRVSIDNAIGSPILDELQLAFDSGRRMHVSFFSDILTASEALTSSGSSTGIFWVDGTAIPEPGTLALMILGILGFGLGRRRGRR